MKEIFINYLFNHNILVNTGLYDSSSESFETRYLLASDFGIKIVKGQELATHDLIPYVSERLGKNVPEPFYRGFPRSVRRLSSDELLFDQIVSYWRTYGLNDFSTPVHSILEREEDLFRPVFNERTDTKEFVIMNLRDASKQLINYYEDLKKSTRPLNDVQYEFVKEYIPEYFPDMAGFASKNTVVKLLNDTRNLAFVKNLVMSDVIKLVDEINYNNYGNGNLKKLNLKNKDRKFITTVIDVLTDRIDTTTCYEKKKIWNGLLHHIHYKPKDDNTARFVRDMRGHGNYSVYSEFEYYMERGMVLNAVDSLKNNKGEAAILRNLNYILSRATSEDQIMQILEELKCSNGLVAIQLYLDSCKYYTENRSFKFVKHGSLKVHDETIEEKHNSKTNLNPHIKKLVRSRLVKIIIKHYADKLGKVYIDPDMKNIALPIQESASNSGFAVLPKGSRIKINSAKLGKKVRAFTYWEKVNDIDISCIGIDSNGSTKEFSWRTMGRLQSRAITFSGDVTSGYNGGSEYFDIDLNVIRANYPELRYLVFCNNIYSCGATFDTCNCKAGFMLRDISDSGKVFEPKTVKTSFAISGNSTFAYLFAIDIYDDEMIWLNVTRSSRERVAGNSNLAFIKNYFNTVDHLNMDMFYKLLGTEEVENPEDADWIISDKHTGDNVIGSCDIEKIMAHINGSWA